MSITRTKKEIGEIAWHKIKELPASKADTEKSDDKKKFWMVAPLVARLRNYLAQKQQKNKLLKGQVLKKPKNAAAPASSAEPPYAQPAASEPPPGLQGAAAASVPHHHPMRSQGWPHRSGGIRCETDCPHRSPAYH